MIYKRLLSYIDEHISRFSLALLCMILFSGITGASMWLIKAVIDKIFIARDMHMLYMIVIIIPSMYLLKGIAAFGQNYLMFYISQNIILKLRGQLFTKLITLSHDFYVRNSSAKMMARVTNDVTLLQTALFQVPPAIFRDGFTIIIMIGVVFFLNWKFALITLLIFPLAALPLVSFAKKMRAASRQGQHQISEIYAVLQEAMTGISVIKTFVQENSEIERFKAENDKYYHAMQRFIRVDARSSPIMEFIGALGVSFIIWYGGRDVISGVWTAGSFFAFMTAVFSIYQPLKNFASTNSILQQAMSGAERIFALLDEKPTIFNDQGAETLPPFKDNIKFDIVTFSYQTDRAVLPNFSLAIKSGEAIALVGPSGSGKTSVANLLLRFYDPQCGSISLDGHDIRKVTLESLRGQIGVVTQDVMLFNDTIAYNISYGNRAATKEDIVAAAKAANAHEYILRLPNGYDTVVGERGVRLSGGERQRLAIARAILKNPPILILDEATSALDAESEKLVQEAIEHLMKDRTTLMIAHRLSTIRRADRIIVLDKGVIVEEGTHDQLVKNEGIYAHLHNLQIL